MYWSNIIIDSEIYTHEYFQQDDVCRLCWNKNANINLFQENSENINESKLLTKIKDCLELDLLKIQPNRICDSCCDEIQRFYSYKKFCRESDKKLLGILETGFSALDNNITELNTIKDEIIEENTFDNDSFLNETIDYEDADNKKLKRNSKIKKKVTRKCSATYCKICCYELETKEKFSKHNNEVHGIEIDGLFRCFGCEKKFKNRKNRFSHEINFCKSLKDGYKCNICDRYLPKRCMYECHIRDHRLNVLTELPEQLFKCTKCCKLFKTKELLVNHRNEHGTEKNFICDICGRIFTRQDYLYKHKLTHSGVKRHECPHCDFRATQRSSLTVHIRKHTGERPYSCDICPQRCISSSNLRAHRRRHLGLKKYECTICNKKFGYKISLEEHISSTHVRSETHSCEHCGATYTRFRGLRRHLSAKHGKQEKNKKENETGSKIEIIKEVEVEFLIKHHNDEHGTV